MLTRILLLLLLASCATEEIVTPPYFDKFKAEGKKRGIDVSYIPKVILTGKLINNYHAYWDGSVIRVDTTSGTWNKLPEETMMHEYGHACLNRQHTQERLPNGMYKSIMGNYSNAQYGGWTKYDSIGYREDYYFDELFNENTEAPVWSLGN